MGLGLSCYQIGNKTCYIPKVRKLCRKRITMLTTLKKSYLTYKCVFYRPENNEKRDPKELNFEGL